MIHRDLLTALLSLALVGCAARHGTLAPGVAAAEFQNTADRPLFIRPYAGLKGEPQWMWSIVQLEPGSAAVVYVVVPQPDQASPAADVYFDEIVHGKTCVPLELRVAENLQQRPLCYRMGMGPDGLPKREPLPDTPTP